MWIFAQNENEIKLGTNIGCEVYRWCDRSNGRPHRLEWLEFSVSARGAILSGGQNDSCVCVREVSSDRIETSSSGIIIIIIITGTEGHHGRSTRRSINTKSTPREKSPVSQSSSSSSPHHRSVTIMITLWPLDRVSGWVSDREHIADETREKYGFRFRIR